MICPVKIENASLFGIDSFIVFLKRHGNDVMWMASLTRKVELV